MSGFLSYWMKYQKHIIHIIQIDGKGEGRKERYRDRGNFPSLSLNCFYNESGNRR